MGVRILSVASEAVPLVKTGGLADVVGALPAALAAQGVEATTLLPAYDGLLARLPRTRVLHRYDRLMGAPATLRAAKLDGHALILLDAPDFFAREGNPYVGPDGRDWPDNARRFAALARAAADLASGAVGRGFDICHAHDWQAALAPAYLRYAAPRRTPSVVTIHNIAFQGSFPAERFADLDLPAQAWSLEGVEYYGNVGFLKAGLANADAITTVSPAYAREIRRSEFGMGLEGLIRGRRNAVHGILNGIDTALWNPATDTALPVRYGPRTLDRREANRAALAERFALDAAPGPLFTVISRLTWQKGIDLIIDCIEPLVQIGARIAILGAGEPAMEAGLRDAARRYPGRVGVEIGYDEGLSHLMQGGGDAILIPSRFEPCGLTQLYALRYGCVPVVARTGGLSDTVIDANPAALSAGAATGVILPELDRDGLADAIRRTTLLFFDRPRWRAMQHAGMAADFGWSRSAADYATLYRSLLESDR